MLKYIVGITATILLFGTNPLYACSPNWEYISRPLAMQIDTKDFFIGKVLSFTEDGPTFEILTPGGRAKDKKAGDIISFESKISDTCGFKKYAVGDIWLNDGRGASFGSSQKLEPSDLTDGYDLEIVKKNVIKRVEPDYVEPMPPLKADLPTSGTYSYKEECDEMGKSIGVMSADYTLKISEPDTVTKNYKVDILMNICRGGHICSYSGEAPAYGYGEIVLPMVDRNGQKISECNLIVQQLSGVNDWPRLKSGEAKVILNDSKCHAYLQCGSNTYLNSPVLKKIY